MNANLEVMILTGYYKPEFGNGTTVEEFLAEKSKYVEKSYELFDVTNFLWVGRHPKEIFDDFLRLCELFKDDEKKFVFFLNDNHAINAFRVAMKRGYLKSLVVWHSNDDGVFELKCYDSGMFSTYPKGFLDQEIEESFELLK